MVLGILIYKRSLLVDSGAIKLFVDPYATFFEEFKTEGASSWMYYLLYAARRVVLVACIRSTSDPTHQVTLVFTASASVNVIQVLMYLLIVMPYKSRMLNLYHTLNEAAISGFHAIFLLTMIPNHSLSFETASNVSSYLLFCTWALNIVPNFSAAVANIILNTRKRARMRIASRTVLPTTEVATITKRAVVRNNKREISTDHLFHINLDN